MCKINENIGPQPSEVKKYELKKPQKTHIEVLKEMFLEYLRQRKNEFSKKKIECVQINSQTINNATNNPITKANMNTKFEFLLDKLYKIQKYLQYI